MAATAGANTGRRSRHEVRPVSNQINWIALPGGRHDAAGMRTRLTLFASLRIEEPVVLTIRQIDRPIEVIEPGTPL